MGLKIPLFKHVEPVHLAKLQADLTNLVSEESLAAILSSVLGKMRSGATLTISELQFALEWNSKLEAKEMILLRERLDRELNQNELALHLMAEYFFNLRQPGVLRLLVTVPFIVERLSDLQKSSFDLFLDNIPVPEKMRGEAAIEYIENLCLIPQQNYSAGQLAQAEPYVSKTDFSEAFETDFERLLRFFSKCGVEFPGVVAKVLDRQLGNLIFKSEAEVTAKAFNSKLGYFKFKSFVESNDKIVGSALPNYQKLLKLIARFEDAVSILSEHEIKRGTFWKSVINQIDGVKFKTNTSTTYSVKYRIAVAFFVGDFVFCDFGPTGNKVHIYDKDTFLSKVEKSYEWQQRTLLSQRISPSLYAHIGDWQSVSRRLISKARQYE